MFEFEIPGKKIRPLIYKKSLTAYYTVCPYCRYENPDSEYHRSMCKLPFARASLDICPCCGNRYDRENSTVIKSKDYMECEALGLKGAVKKNEKGQWVQA